MFRQELKCGRSNVVLEGYGQAKTWALKKKLPPETLLTLQQLRMMTAENLLLREKPLKICTPKYI